MTARITPNCPHCGAVLPAHAPAGLCPRCLMAMNLAEPTILSGDDTDSPASAPPPAPEEIARFFPTLDILECLGRGGMGVVYKARQKSLNRLVALKILAPERVTDPAFAQRFAVEAEALAKLNHPDIVTIHDFGQADGLFYFIMEFVDGVNLRQLLEVGRIAPREALAIVPQICDALQYAHDQGIIHRDIKPENILLDRRGRVKVADFGLAKLMGSSSPSARSDPSDPSDQPTQQTVTTTEAGQVMGTPQYMAPEQRDHPTEVDHRADIYSLGVVFYQMLTGELPGSDLQPPSRKVLIDVRLDEVVLRALAQEPQRRYQQVSEVRTLVETIVSTPHATGESAAQVPASSSPAKVSSCYVSTPEHLRTFRGRFLSIYLGKGELRLDDQALVFLGGWQAVTIPLSSIRKLAQGVYPYSAKPVPLHYIALTFAEHGVERTLLFTPVLKEVMSPWEANKVGAEWLTALQDAVRACTGRVLAVERCDLAHDRFWLAKTALVAAPPFMVAFLISWLLVSQGLPGLGDLLMFVAVGVPTMVVVLMVLRWRHRSALVQEQGARATQPPRFSRTAIVGAVWAPLFFIAFVLAFTVHTVVPAGEYHGPAWWQYLLRFTVLPLGVAAPFGTTILGCVALSQIRHSAGRLYGLGLALFDALLFPLLVLDGLIFWLWFWFAQFWPRWTSGAIQLNFESFLLLTTMSAVLADVLIARRVWRAVNKTVGGRPSDPMAAEPGANHPLRPALLTAAWHAALLLGTLGCFVVVVPRFSAMYSDLAVALPTLTALTVTVGNAIARHGFLLSPVLLALLALDAGICILTQLLAGRRLRNIWSALVVGGCGAVVLTAGISLYLPMRSLSRVVSATPPASGEVWLQDNTSDVQADGTVRFKLRCESVNRQSHSVETEEFVNSNFIHVEKITDTHGWPVHFEARPEGKGHFRYRLTLNKPVPPGGKITTVSEGIAVGLVKGTTQRGVYEYRMNHWPACDAVMRRIELHRLPAGAGLVAKSANLQAGRAGGRVELRADSRIPPGGNIEVWYRYRLPAGIVAPIDNPVESAGGAPTGEQTVATFDWTRLAAEGRLLGGVPTEADGRHALRIANPNDAPLQLELFKIENPAITSKRYAVSGEIRYENVEGDGYLEMWSCFPPAEPGLPAGRFFTRTLGAVGSGPMARISGTSGWRPFSLSFDATATSDAPTRLELNFILPGRGVVFLGPVKLSQWTPPPAPDDATSGPVIERTTVGQTDDSSPATPTARLPDRGSFAGFTLVLAVLLLALPLTAVAIILLVSRAGNKPAKALAESGAGASPPIAPSNGPDAKAAGLGRLALGLCLIGLVLPVAAAFPMLTGTVDLVTVSGRMCIVALAVSGLFGLPALVLGILGWKSGAGKAAVIIAVVVPLLALPAGVILYPVWARSSVRAKAETAKLRLRSAAISRPFESPEVSGALAVQPIVVCPDADGLKATLVFNIATNLATPISFDVGLRLGDNKFRCGHISCDERQSHDSKRIEHE